MGMPAERVTAINAADLVGDLSALGSILEQEAGR
jgi:hypothetical protein